MFMTRKNKYTRAEVKRVRTLLQAVISSLQKSLKNNPTDLYAKGVCAGLRGLLPRAQSIIYSTGLKIRKKKCFKIKLCNFVRDMTEVLARAGYVPRRLSDLF